jgi:DNA primase
MMRDRDVALSVHSKLNDAFNLKNHAAIAAYLYAYYLSGHEADAAKFVSTLEDHELEAVATEILMMDGGFPFDDQVMEAWLADIKKVPVLKELETKKELSLSAERSGDFLTAAQMQKEIISLERQLKNYLN